MNTSVTAKKDINSLTIELTPVPLASKKILENILELYVYDFTEYMDFDLDENGLYLYPLEEYWTCPDHKAFFIKAAGNYAGFVLVKTNQIKEDKKFNTIGEFFILKKYRSSGIGQTAAEMIFNLFPGHWVIYESKKNLPAQRFWQKAIRHISNDDFKEYWHDNKLYQEFDTKKVNE